jgi:acetoin utilization deacetylase AcuC-like enzyme
MPTAFITHSDYIKHDTGLYHPECPARLQAITDRITTTKRDYPDSPLNNLLHLTPQSADKAWIKAVHDPDYVDAVPRWCQAGYSDLPTGDTSICPASYDVALLAAGACTLGIDTVMGGQADLAFCAVRPPGHHAEYDRGMGFCLFNNIAVAARYAQHKYGLNRILIIDWDVHHGNGTQHIFERDSSVYYISIHQSPHYPFTGRMDETGMGDGKGTTLNIPVSSGTGNEVYLAAFNDKVATAVNEFQPNLILISAGFDAHRDDPLSGTLVTEEGFGEMTRLVKAFARTHCDGRMVSVLEGGYDLMALAGCVECHLLELLKE